MPNVGLLSENIGHFRNIQMPQQVKGGIVTKKLFTFVEIKGEAEGYVVSDYTLHVDDPKRFRFYNPDGIYIYDGPREFLRVEDLGEVETADDFERLTGHQPQLFFQDCRICGQPALLLVEHDDGVCVDCQPERGEEGIDYVN